MSIRFKSQLLGVKEAQAKMKKMPDSGREALAKVLKIGLLKIQGDAQANVPVKTGRLKMSITVSVSQSKDVVSGSVGTLGSDVPYAVFVEYGTSRMSARPFLLPAVERNKEQIKKNIGRIFDRI